MGGSQSVTDREEERESQPVSPNNDPQEGYVRRWSLDLLPRLILGPMRRIERLILRYYSADEDPNREEERESQPVSPNNDPQEVPDPSRIRVQTPNMTDEEPDREEERQSLEAPSMPRRSDVLTPTSRRNRNRSQRDQLSSNLKWILLFGLVPYLSRWSCETLLESSSSKEPYFFPDPSRIRVQTPNMIDLESDSSKELSFLADKEPYRRDKTRSLLGSMKRSRSLDSLLLNKSRMLIEELGLLNQRFKKLSRSLDFLRPNMTNEEPDREEERQSLLGSMRLIEGQIFEYYSRRNRNRSQRDQPSSMLDYAETFAASWTVDSRRNRNRSQRDQLSSMLDYAETFAASWTVDRDDESDSSSEES